MVDIISNRLCSTFQLKYSPLLESLLGRQACCFCHGQHCDGKSDPFGITLADVDVATVHLLLDILYTGKAYFASRY